MTTENENSGKMEWCSSGRRWRWWWFMAPVFIALAVFVFGSAVMYLWNWLVPSIFTSLGPITFWQAIGILILSKILFGGFRGRGGWRGGCGCGGYGWRGRRHMQWKEKWMNMSEEDKAKLKEEWKKRCESGNC